MKILRRIIGKRVKIPYGPAAVSVEQGSIDHWETGKRNCCEEAKVRRPAFHVAMYSVTSDDRMPGSLFAVQRFTQRAPV